MKTLNSLTALLAFLKLGIISFGGGAALLPIIRDELVDNKRWMDNESFSFVAMVGTVSPASLPVALCSVWHNRYSVISAYAYAFPGPVLFLAILTGFALIGEAGVLLIGFVSVGIIAFILMIISLFIQRNYLHGVDMGIKRPYLIVMGCAFILTCGNVIVRLSGVLFGASPDALPIPIFALSMLDLIFMAFFIILFMGASASKFKFGIALLLAGAFVLARGRIAILDGWGFWLGAVMIALAIGSIIYDFVKNRDKGSPVKMDFKPLRNFVLFVLISTILTVIVYFISGNSQTWEYSLRIVLSAITTFGGGEAYIAVADGIFVQTGFITAEAYYGQVIGISSAMPGPVLMSIAAGIGFVYGNALGGVLYGWLFGLLSIAIAVAATAFGAIFLYVCFGMFKESYRLKMVIKYMMPIVCGILIGIFFTLLNQAAGVLVRGGINAWVAFGIVFAIYLCMMFLRKKYRIKDIPLILAGGFLSLTGLVVFHYVL